MEGRDAYTDGWRAYDGLVTNGYQHQRVHHHEIREVKKYVNGIDAFFGVMQSFTWQNFAVSGRKNSSFSSMNRSDISTIGFIKSSQFSLIKPAIFPSKVGKTLH